MIRPVFYKLNLKNSTSNVHLFFFFNVFKKIIKYSSDGCGDVGVKHIPYNFVLGQQTLSDTNLHVLQCSKTPHNSNILVSSFSRKQNGCSNTKAVNSKEHLKYTVSLASLKELNW